MQIYLFMINYNVPFCYANGFKSAFSVVIISFFYVSQFQQWKQSACYLITGFNSQFQCTCVQLHCLYHTYYVGIFNCFKIRSLMELNQMCFPSAHTNMHTSVLVLEKTISKIQFHDQTRPFNLSGDNTLGKLANWRQESFLVFSFSVFQKKVSKQSIQNTRVSHRETSVVHSPWIKKCHVHARCISTGNNPVVPVEVLFSGFLILWVLFCFYLQVSWIGS